MLHLFIKNKNFYQHPGRFWNKYPEKWTRGGLIVSSWFVSFFHGSNDGQKGVGLAMLILISLAPGYFAMNPAADLTVVKKNIEIVQARFNELDMTTVSSADAVVIQETKDNIQAIQTILSKENVEVSERILVRKHILKIQKDYTSLSKKQFALIPSASAAGTSNSITDISPSISAISTVTDYAPMWIIAMISISLGLGTMVGWKRIVITIGEKIGKDKLTYAQGTVATLMTALTIAGSTFYSLPVSTTHILSSSVAGTMAHEHGKGGLRGDTIRSILMAWVLTLPVATILAATIFLFLHAVFVK